MFQIGTPSPGSRGLRLRRWDESHMLLLQEFPLPLRAAEGEAGRKRTVAENHTMAWDHTWFGIRVQRVPYDSGIARVPCEGCDLAIGRDFSCRDATDHLIHSL